MAKRVLIITPYISRDLEGNALVGHHLKAKYDIECIYVNGYNTLLKIFKYKPHAIVWDHLAWDFKVNDLKIAHRCGIKTFCLPTEGFFIIDRDAVKATGEYHGAEPHLDHYFTWGEWVRDSILKYKALPAPKMSIVGCPRFDYYHIPTFSNYYLSREDFCKKHGISNFEAPILLWAPTSVQIGRNLEERLKLYTDRGDNSIQEVSDLFEDGQIEFENHSKAVTQLAEKFPNVNIIIKIHPAAMVEPYLPLAENHPNIKIGFNSHIRDYLYHSDLLMQRNCTTATEAWMLGKPVTQIEFESVGYKFPGDETFMDGSFISRNFEQLSQFVDDVIAKRYNISPEIVKAREDYISKFYYKIDGQAALRVADIIASTLATAPSDAEVQSNTDKAEKGYWKAYNSRPASKLRNLLGLPHDFSFRFLKKAKSGKSKGKLADGEREATPNELEVVQNRIRDCYETAKA